MKKTKNILIDLKMDWKFKIKKNIQRLNLETKSVRIFLIINLIM